MISGGSAAALAAGITGDSESKFTHDNFLQTQDPELGWIRNVMRVAGTRCDAERQSSQDGLEFVLREWIGDDESGQLGYYRRKAAQWIKRNRNTERLSALALAASIIVILLILFGGGFALAQGFQLSGLTEWIGNRLDFLTGTHWLVFVIVIALVTIFLTEITSNTATASMLLPIVAGLAGGSGEAAFYPMVATALAASFAFMLPVATPPNAIIFASRQITIPEMVRAGIWMNLAGVVLITLAAFFLLPLIWG